MQWTRPGAFVKWPQNRSIRTKERCAGLRYVDFILVQPLENIVPDLVEPTGIYKLRFICAHLFMVLEISNELEVTPTGLALKLFEVIRQNYECTTYGFSTD